MLSVGYSGTNLVAPESPAARLAVKLVIQYDQ